MRHPGVFGVAIVAAIVGTGDAPTWLCEECGGCGSGHRGDGKRSGDAPRLVLMDVMDEHRFWGNRLGS